MENKMNIYGKIAAIKKRLTEIKIAKSGLNNYSNFRYYELTDFLTHIISLNNELGVDDTITISRIDDKATIRLTNVDDANDFKEVSIPYTDAEMLGKGGTPSTIDAIQRTGATVTYIRRYLYVTAYDIKDSDGIDPNDNVESNFDKLTKLIRGTVYTIETINTWIKVKYGKPIKIEDLTDTQFDLMYDALASKIMEQQNENKG